MQENNDTMESRMNIIEQKLEALHTSLGQLSAHFLTLQHVSDLSTGHPGLYSGMTFNFFELSRIYM